MILSEGEKVSFERKSEMEFFTGTDGYVHLCTYCLRCANDCKQSFRVIVMKCQNFIRKDTPS